MAGETDDEAVPDVEHVDAQERSRVSSLFDYIENTPTAAHDRKLSSGGAESLPLAGGDTKLSSPAADQRETEPAAVPISSVVTGQISSIHTVVDGHGTEFIYMGVAGKYRRDVLAQGIEAREPVVINRQRVEGLWLIPYRRHTGEVMHLILTQPQLDRIGWLQHLFDYSGESLAPRFGQALSAQGETIYLGNDAYDRFSLARSISEWHPVIPKAGLVAFLYRGPDYWSEPSISGADCGNRHVRLTDSQYRQLKALLATTVATAEPAANENATANHRGPLNRAWDAVRGHTPT